MPNISTKTPTDNNLNERSFDALCQSRAYRYGQGELHLHDAVDWLQRWAESHNLDTDNAQWVMACAFLPYREDLQ